jgi:hypothetical protein
MLPLFSVVLNEEKMFPRCGTRSFTSPGVHWDFLDTQESTTDVALIKGSYFVFQERID